MKTLSDYHKQRISEGSKICKTQSRKEEGMKKGSKCTPEHKQKVAEAMRKIKKGVPLSEFHKQRIKEGMAAVKGTPKDRERSRKLSISTSRIKKGVPLSESHKQKISTSLTRRPSS